jgi:F-type H+-transporting ATPase subunit gamma
MANLLSLKRRIKAARNVSKTTKAMQMIAVSKLKKAQDATVAGRPYVEKLSIVSQNVLSRLENDEYTHEYMKKSENNKSLIIIFSPDKAFCGGLITNLTREIINFDKENKNNVYLTVGKKVESTIVGLGKELVAAFNFGTTLPSFDKVLPIVKIIDEYFLTQSVGNVKLISTNFTSIFSQKPTITNILPIELTKSESKSSTLFEPLPQELLPPLLRHYLEMTIYQHLLESYTSEQGARMVAMQNATDNALEIVEDLQLEYNKGRQEKITNEILDIGSAAFTYAYE